MSTPYPAYGRSEVYPPTFSSSTHRNSTFKAGPDDRDRIGRGMSRTPSPTPSEAKILNEPLFSMAQLLNWRFWIRKEWTKYYIIVTIILTLTALISFYHHQIVHALTPVTNWMHGLKYGFLIPIGILFVISFPPLFGHEIVAILCGVVWGLWIGFAIVCAGTFLGEVGNFYAFKLCCKARGEKMEKTQIPYACLARCVRTGGFKIALIARFSAIPGHFTTAVFSTCGMNIFVFAIAAILSLPKQFITVYVGVILEQSEDGTSSTKSKLISDGVLAATFLVTLLAMWYIFHQMALAKPAVIYERRKARQGKMQGIDLGSGMYGAQNDSESSITYSGDGVDIPLTAKFGSASSSNTLTAGPGVHPRYDYERQQRQRQAEEWAAQRRQYDLQPGNFNPQDDMARYNPYSPRGDGMGEHQQWDAQGRAVGYTPGPGGAVMWAPQPQQARPTAMTTNSSGGGRTPIAPGSVYSGYMAGGPPTQHIPGEAEVYAHGRAPAYVRGDDSEAGWEVMGAGAGAEMRQVQPSSQQQQPPSRQLTQPPSRQQTQPPSRQQTQAYAQAQSPPQVPGQQLQLQPADPGTPTQAQYATYVEPPSAASTTLAYLRSPFEDPSHTLDASEDSTDTFGGHAVEPTGASYHTAYGSEGEHDGQGPQRANSLATESASQYSYDYAMGHGQARR